MPRYRVEVDPMICTGAQMCVSTAPHAFTFDDEAFVSRASTDAFADEEVREAAESCPVEAIRLHDADTGEQLFP